MTANRPVRVLTFLHSFAPGGVEQVALRLGDAWSSAGIDVRMVMGRGDGPLRRIAPRLRYDILQRGRRSTARFETLWMIARLPAAIRRHKPDVLFCAGNSYAVVAVAMKLVMGRACPPILMKVSNDLARRDLPWPGRVGYHIWLRVQGRSIDRFAGMAECARIEIAIAMGVPSRRIEIIPDPAIGVADITMLRAQRAAAKPGNGRRFLAVGRLVPQKNFALLLRAFARIAGDGDQLTILGEGPQRARLERLARRLGIADRVTMPGHSDPRDGWLAAADQFLLSSDYEGVPAVIVEALAAGLPIVATRCSVSIAGMLDGGRLGRLVPVGDVAALSAALAQPPPSTDPDAAADHARRFTIEAAAPRYVAVLRQMVSRADCGPAAAVTSRVRRGG